MTRTEEFEFWCRAREVSAHPDPARREKAWKAIWMLFRAARDPAVHARALSMVEERTGCVWLLSEDRTVIVAVRPSATCCRIPARAAS